MSKRHQAYFLLLTNTLFWSVALFFVKPAFETTTPFRFLFYRYFIAVLVSLPILFWQIGKFLLKIKHLITIILLELIGTSLALGLLYLGLDKTSALEASIISTTTPIFIIIGGVIFLKEKQERHETVGMIISCLATLVFVALPYLNQNVSFGMTTFKGNILILAQNIVVAIYFLAAKKYYNKIPKLLVTSISFYVGLISFFILSLLELGGSINLFHSALNIDLSSRSVWWASFYMAIFASIIGLTAYIKGQELIETSEASLFAYLQPLFYVPLGYFLFKEKLSWPHLFLLGMILAGVFIAERRKTPRKKAPN